IRPPRRGAHLFTRVSVMLATGNGRRPAGRRPGKGLGLTMKRTAPRTSSRSGQPPEGEGALDENGGRLDLRATAQLVDALIATGREEGYLTFDEVTRALATAPRIDRAVNGLLKRLSAEGIDIRDTDSHPPPTARGTPPPTEPPSKPSDERLSEAPPGESAKPAVDPIQAYLGKMGSLSLLTREGEVEFARRIERGRRRILWALAHSSVRMPELTDLIER